MLWLVRPKLRSKLNRARTDEARLFKALLLGFVGLFFWTFTFLVIFRMLLYFRGTQGIGDLLAGKLLAVAFLTFFSILLLSNVITALSTFFLSDDLELVIAAPIDPVKVYGARLAETILDSSWMVALMAVPLLAAYGVIYAAGPFYYLLATLTMAAFLVVPAVIGTGVTLLLVNVFPARRARDLLALMGLFAAAGVVVLFRFLRPERLVRPEVLPEPGRFRGCAPNSDLGLAAQRVGRGYPDVVARWVVRCVPVSVPVEHRGGLRGDRRVGSRAPLRARLHESAGGCGSAGRGPSDALGRRTTRARFAPHPRAGGQGVEGVLP